MQNEENASHGTVADGSGPQTPMASLNSASQIWTPTQRRSVLILSLALLVFLGVESLRKSSVLSDPLPQESPRAAEIQDRLDPNVADAAALAAIPEVGEKRAQQIVAYREWFRPRYPGQRAFESADDLVRIKGIGLATVDHVRDYLIFPQNREGHATSEFSPE